MRTVEQRFNQKVIRDTGGGCWAWTAATDDHGYGILRIEGKNVRAHRVSWELHVGPIPDGLRVLHRCDNPPCTNPNHLFCGTMKDNTQDMLAKQRNGAVVHPERILRGSRIGNAKLNEKKVAEIKRKIIAGMGNTEIAPEYGVDHSTISLIRRGIWWRHVSP